MKQFFLTAAAAALLLFGLPVLSHARVIMPPSGDGGFASVFGQNHAYTVTFRGNGEAVVNLKVALTNNEEATQSAVMLRVPRVQPQDVVAFQVIHEPQCIHWGQQEYDPTTGTYQPPQPECLRYQEPDYYSYYYGNATYKKAGVDVSGDTITITLPDGIAPQQSASFLLYYRALGYTHQSSFGSYTYEFETLKTEDPINQLQVGIATDSDMVLKGAQSNVEYRFDETVAMESAAAPDSKMGLSNSRFNNYYHQIGQGSIVKTATYLQPLDSFTVEGAYADSWWQLYGKQGLIGIGVVIIGALVILYLISQLVKVINRRRQRSVSATKTSAASWHAKALWMGGASFISSLLAALYTIVLFILIRFVDTLYYSDFNILIVLFMIIVSLGVYPMLLFGPSLFLGMKKGLWWGIGTFTLTILWLLFFLLSVFTFLMITRSSHYPQPLPYMRGVDSSPAMPSEKLME